MKSRGVQKLVTAMNATAAPITAVADQPKKRCRRLMVKAPISTNHVHQSVAAIWIANITPPVYVQARSAVSCLVNHVVL